MAYLDHFFHAVAAGSMQSYVGVSIIFIYFVVMLLAIRFRIKKGDHMHH